MAGLIDYKDYERRAKRADVATFDDPHHTWLLSMLNDIADSLAKIVEMQKPNQNCGKGQVMETDKSLTPYLLAHPESPDFRWAGMTEPCSYCGKDTLTDCRVLVTTIEIRGHGKVETRIWFCTSCYKKFLKKVRMLEDELLKLAEGYRANNGT